MACLCPCAWPTTLEYSLVENRNLPYYHLRDTQVLPISAFSPPTVPTESWLAFTLLSPASLPLHASPSVRLHCSRLPCVCRLLTSQLVHELGLPFLRLHYSEIIHYCKDNLRSGGLLWRVAILLPLVTWLRCCLMGFFIETYGFPFCTQSLFVAGLPRLGPPDMLS